MHVLRISEYRAMSLGLISKTDEVTLTVAVVISDAPSVVVVMTVEPFVVVVSLGKTTFLHAQRPTTDKHRNAANSFFIVFSST